MSEADRDLIVDIGMSEGNDSSNYLRKGFRVFGIEADPIMFTRLQERFVKQLQDGQLQLHNRAALDVSGKAVEFWHNEAAQGTSSLKRRPHPQWQDTQTLHSVQSIDWPEIVDRAGLPYYCKIDIEGAEPQFLSSMAGRLLPPYISIEAHSFDGIEVLFLLGYRKFKLVNQAIHPKFLPPQPPLEGKYVERLETHHVSGLFGLETPGKRWLDFRETVLAFEMFRKLNDLDSVLHGYLDCHATNAPVPAGQHTVT